jgi:hypothetical protein
MKKPGSLLVDLMVAMTIFLFATSLVVHLGYAVTKMHCIMELFLLKQTINATRLEAMATGTDQTILINPDENEYTKGSATIRFTTLSIAKKRMSIPSLNDQKEFIPCSFAHNTITCFKSGIIGGGTLYFYANDDKSLFFCLSCPVSQANNIHTYEYKNGWVLFS